jgi:hypothetical protein
MMYETTVTLESACSGGLRAPSKHFAAPDPLERKTVNSPLNKIKSWVRLCGRKAPDRQLNGPVK